MCNGLNNCNCLATLLENILILQGNNNINYLGCDRPMLGSLPTIANTRPINLYNCCTGEIWTMPYTLGETTGTSTFFRIENVNDNCATFRILVQNDTGYTPTNNFFTINLKCISSIKCLGDVLITGL